MNIEEQIKIRLAVLNPIFIDLKNESYKHRNHKDKFNVEHSETHFKLTILSQQFRNLNMIQIHRKIFALVKDLMNNPIHSLSIDAKAD